MPRQSAAGVDRCPPRASFSQESFICGLKAAPGVPLRQDALVRGRYALRATAQDTRARARGESAKDTQVTNQLLIAVLVGSAALAASPAPANWLSSDDLERHCGAYLSDPVSTEAVGCIAFVQGYVAAAGASNTSVGARDDAASFTERAARTRAGSRLRSMRDEPASRRAFCVEDTPPAAVVEAVATHLSRVARAEDAAPEHLVHRALVAQFPCSDA